MCIESIELLVGTAKNLEEPAQETAPICSVADILFEDRKQVTLKWDDAVTVLRSLTQANKESLKL